MNTTVFSHSQLRARATGLWRYFLIASLRSSAAPLSFSPACLSFPEDWSAFPLVRCCLLSRSAPAASSIRPLASVTFPLFGISLSSGSRCTNRSLRGSRLLRLRPKHHACTQRYKVHSSTVDPAGISASPDHARRLLPVSYTHLTLP